MTVVDEGRLGFADRAATASQRSPQAVSGIAGITDACMHRNLTVNWDNHVCNDCGWVLPDSGHKRDTDAGYDEWFPSMFAFQNYKRSGERPWLPKRTDEDERTEAETYANARLIAFAPELLEALRAIAETRWDMGAADACVVAMKQVAAAAIAKVRGDA